ncbi:hypothetical protein PAXINDRAFT_14187 [Paxillus involutus ATCC 200175]|uniref:DUF6533 domain-containing protein n=1 Tax=Paxillus involutus ATCC 200175 TaxID=664439 RepID=A0A0C9TZH8_PAXIN|nr:hypothetical protein PAXINDRAFT_14187 [Paxillus involutus ATCC 200175]
MPSTKQIFDYFYQLEDELMLIWSRGGWSIGKALFMPTRYIPFIIIPFMLFSSFAVNVGAHTCKTVLCVLVVLETIAITLSQVIFGLRAKATTFSLNLLAVPLTFAAQAYVTAVVCILHSFLPSVTYGRHPLPINSGCYKTGGSSIDFATYVVIMLADAVTTTLTVYRAYRHFRHTPNALVQNMTRDGVLYCVSVFSMSIANVLIMLLVPPQYTDIITVYQTVMHTMLATRMQLHLRKCDQHAYVDIFTEGSRVPVSPMRFTFPTDV